MKLINANYIVTCSSDFKIIKNGAILFDKKILKIDKKEILLKEYPNVEVIECGENSVILPSFTNPHVHLEFSGNKTTLKYGDFMEWLNSVIKNREELTAKCSKECIEKALEDMLRSGITAIGAISNYLFDLEPCVNSPIKVTYFNEAIGSKPEMVDALYQDFLSRFGQSSEYNSENFKASIAIHSPYSAHPILIKKILQIAKDENLIVSTHLLESKAERDWLDKSEGDFVPFFKNFLNQNKSLTTPIEFIKLFEGVKTLFVHLLYANKDELSEVAKIGGEVITCPISNRLLNNKVLNLKSIKEANLNLSIATDGLTSNYSLNMFEEFRTTLFAYPNENLNEFAKELILMATKGGAKALNLNSGEISKDKSSDFIVVNLADKSEVEDVVLNLLLHTKEVNRVFINGKKIL